MDLESAQGIARRLDVLARDVAGIRANRLTKDDLHQAFASTAFTSLKGPLAGACRKQFWTFVIAISTWNVLLVVAVYLFSHYVR
jgi:hypothetical protein